VINARGYNTARRDESKADREMLLQGSNWTTMIEHQAPSIRVSMALKKKLFTSRILHDSAAGTNDSAAANRRIIKRPNVNHVSTFRSSSGHERGNEIWRSQNLLFECVLESWTSLAKLID
jgi:hypothetical protein